MQWHETGPQPAVECRRYWRDGYIADREWWHAGRLLVEQPAGEAAVTSDYCEAHRTRIYSDLGCQYCHERPGHTLTRPRPPRAVRPPV